MSRDSVILTIGMIGAILTALANQVGAFPPAWVPYISLAALIVGVISGKLATSPLKGDAEIAVDKAIAIDKVIDAKVETGEIDKGAVNLRNVGPLVLPLVLASTLALMACHPPVTIQTPAGQRAYTADQIVLRVNELQAAAIQAESTGGLPTATTRVIVRFCVTANQTLALTPEGWGVTVFKGWEAVKVDPLVKPYLVSNPSVALAASAVDLVLAIFGGAA